MHDDPDPPSAALGWRDTRPWSDVEAALPAALTARGASVTDGGGFGLTIAYVPFSTLGEREGADLSWEALLRRGGSVGGYELAGHPAAVLDVVRGSTSLTAPGVVEEDDLRRWAGWSATWRLLARAVCHLPPDEAVLDLSVDLDVQDGAPPSWSWTVEIPVPGVEWPPSAWSAATPHAALQQALDQADLWLAGRPAGHLTGADDRRGVGHGRA